MAEIISHGFKEETEHPVAIHTIVILAFAVRTSMPVDKGREESPVTENAYEHMSTTHPCPSSAIAMHGSSEGVCSIMQNISLL